MTTMDATKVRITGEDATGPVFQSVERRLKGLEAAAADTTKKLAGSGSVFDELGKGLEQGLGRGLRAVTAEMGPLARSATAAIVPLGAAAMGAAAALGALAVAYNEGAKENDAYVRALALNNNVIGLTADSLATLAREVGAVSGSQAKAAEVVSRLAGGGRVAAENLSRFTSTAIEMERTLGISIEQTARDFEALAKAPVEASLKLNETHRHLTAEVLNQIKALEDQGRASEAAALAQGAYADGAERAMGKVRDNLGPLQRSWAAIEEIAKKAWDAMLGIGRQDDMRQQLDAARAQLQRMSPGGEQYGRFAQEEIDRQRKLVEFLEARVNTTEGLAAAEGEYNRRQQAAIAAQRENAKWAEEALTRQEKLNKALDDYRRNNDAIRAAGGTLDQAQIAREEAAIRAKFAEPTRVPGAKISEIDRYIERLQKQLDKTNEITEQERLLRDIQAGRFGKANEEQLKQAKSLASLVDSRREEVAAAKAEAEMQDLLGRLRQKEIDNNIRIAQQMEDRANKWLDELDPMRVFIRHIEDVDRVVGELQKKGWIFTPEQIAAMKELGAGVEKTMNDADRWAKQAAKNIQSYLGDELFNVLDGKFDSIGKSFGRMLKRIAAEAMAADISRWLFGDFQKKNGVVGGLLGDGLKWLGGLFSGAPGHATGLDYVPRDNYVARLHEGEAVLTKDENRRRGRAQASAPSVSVVNHYKFESGANVAQLKFFAENIKKDTIATIFDMQKRNDVWR